MNHVTKDIIQKKAPHLALNVQKDNHQIKIHHLVFYVPQVHFRIIIMLNVPPVLQDIIIQKKEHPNVVNVLLGHFLKKLGLLLALVVHLVLILMEQIINVVLVLLELIIQILELPNVLNAHLENIQKMVLFLVLNARLDIIIQKKELRNV